MEKGLDAYNNKKNQNPSYTDRILFRSLNGLDGKVAPLYYGADMLLELVWINNIGAVPDWGGDLLCGRSKNTGSECAPTNCVEGRGKGLGRVLRCVTGRVWSVVLTTCRVTTGQSVRGFECLWSCRTCRWIRYARVDCAASRGEVCSTVHRGCT